MRTARLLGVILSLLTTGLLAAPVAGAQPPFRLQDYVTDNAAALTYSGRASVNSALDRLYADHHIRLWVVYVDNFSEQSPVDWVQHARSMSDLGNYDATLAVATTDRAYAFLVPAAVQGISESQIADVRRNQIEPALRKGDWSGAAVAAADGLNRTPSSSGRFVLLAVLAVIVIGTTALVVVMRYRARQRRAAELAAARQVDPTDPNALAAVPVDALDDLSCAMVVDVDNAVRTSTNELAVAVDEFGEERTKPFTEAVNNAKAALSQAFTIRQQLDDSVPETPTQRHDLLIRVIVSAARADRELESQRAAFDKMRDLVINAPSLLDRFTEQYVELTSRIDPAEQRLAQLRDEFDAAALTSVTGNIVTAKERLAFADRNIASARDMTSRAVSGQQFRLVDAVRAAESALGQVRSLLDAVDSADGDIKHAVDTLPSVTAHVQAGIQQADEQLKKAQNAKSRRLAELTAARDAAGRAVASARGAGAVDPLGAYARLTKADADLTKLLATLAEEQATAERLSRSYEQALFTAESRIRGVSEYIDTRRGSIGPEARTRLAEARRHLQTAHDIKATDLTEAIAHANAASTLAAQAQTLANADVQSAQRSRARRSGDDTGAMIGGIIMGDLLGGGLQGGLGSWTSTSFGGSPRSSGGSFGGGLMGGGGRF